MSTTTATLIYTTETQPITVAAPVSAPYGYVVCRTCGYEREVGVPCGLPCV